MGVLNSVKKLFTAKVPDIERFRGRTLKIPGVPEPVRIETVRGCVGMTLGRKAEDIRPQYYEINGKHLIGMLRFHAQMENDKSITEEQFKAFEDMEFYVEDAKKDREIISKEDLRKNIKVVDCEVKDVKES